MINLSLCFDRFRGDLLEAFPDKFPNWPVLHLVFPGETDPQNFRGNGPWARIWVTKAPRHVIYPPNHLGGPPLVSYIVGVYIPRVYTTDDILETLIHEYLHVGEKLGELNEHPPGVEEEFIAESEDWALRVRSRFGSERPCLKAIEGPWERISLQRPCGFTLDPSELISSHIVPLAPRVIDVGALQ